MFWFFGCEACGILAPPPGIEPAPPALEGEVLTTGPPGKSPLCNILMVMFFLKFSRGFPGGAVVENLPANAGDTGSSPGLGRSHMPRSD